MKPMQAAMCYALHFFFIIAVSLFSLISPVSRGEELTPVTTVTYVEGSASLKPAGKADWIKLGEDWAVGTGDEIKTGPDGSVELLLADESVLKIGADTHVLVKKAGMVETTKLATSVFDLFVGKVRAIVAPFVNNDSEFIIETENTTVGVRGTDFGVSHDTKTKETEVLCMDGDIELNPKEAVMRGLAPIIVRGNEGIRLIAGRKPERPTVWLKEKGDRFFRGLDFKGKRAREIIDRRFKKLGSGGYQFIDKLKGGGDAIKFGGDKIKSGTKRFFNRVKRR